MVPQALLFVLLLLNIASLPLPNADAVKAHLVLMAVYYWAIYRPTLIPPAFCFAIGLVIDLVAHLPMGLNAVVLLLVQWLVRDQRRFLMGQPYVVIWAVYGLVALSASMLQWVLYGVFNMHWAPVMPILSGALISLLLFPFVTMLLVFTHRLLPVESRVYP